MGSAKTSDLKYFIRSSRVKPKTLERDGAHGVKVRYLVGRGEGATKFYLRQYNVNPGGNTSLDNHAYEHEVYILKGKARVRVGKAINTVKAGDAIYIPSSVTHQFKNVGKEALVFLCVKGDEQLYA
jgi:mannose-6-phosphate isomerase-like protein (cupin superfamily)